MKTIRNYLETCLDAVVEDIKFYDVRGDEANTAESERHAERLKEWLDILSQIEKEREGNLIRFNDDGTFTLWCIRIPEGGEQIIELYDAGINFEDYEELIETAPILDVTDSFDINDIVTSVIVTDDIINCCKRSDVYFFVSNDTLQLAS